MAFVLLQFFLFIRVYLLFYSWIPSWYNIAVEFFCNFRKKLNYILSIFFTILVVFFFVLSFYYTSFSRYYHVTIISKLIQLDTSLNC